MHTLMLKRGQVVLEDVRALQVIKAGRLNLLPATVTLPSSSVRYMVSSGPRTPESHGELTTGAARVPGPLEAGLVFELAALARLAARSNELQAEHVRAEVCVTTDLPLRDRAEVPPTTAAPAAQLNGDHDVRSKVLVVLCSTAG